MQRHYLDGKPYYCKTCGLGYGEYMACEEIDCEMESETDAQDRSAAAQASDDFDRNGGTPLDELKAPLATKDKG